jgi:hypothetical protein
MKPRDYEELLESFNAHGVRYLIVGAHAVAFHARPRATKDLDILVEPKPRNAERVLAAIRSFLGSDLGLTVPDLTSPGNIVQLGLAPSRSDLMSKLASADFGARGGVLDNLAPGSAGEKRGDVRCGRAGGRHNACTLLW